MNNITPPAATAPVPDGWVMVPREPTPEMIAAMPYPANTIPAVGVACYRAMIAASPADPIVRKPLTDEQIAMWFRRGIGRWMTPGTAFAAGVRSAERHHGIAASPEPAPVPLTDEQIINLRVQTKGDYKPWSESIAFARAIERAHGIAASPEVP